MSRRALIVTYYFPPLGGGGVQRIGKLVKYLSRRGWTFTVITAEEESVTLPRDPTLLAEIPSSTRVIRLPGSGMPIRSSQAAKTSSYWKRWLSAFLYIPDMRKSWIPVAGNTVKKELESQAYDCIIVSIPPYSLAHLAAELKHTSGLPVLLDMRDPWTMNPYKIHPTPLHRYLDRRQEFAAVKTLPYGTSAYRTLIEFYKEELVGFTGDGWLFFPNGYDESDFRNIKPVRHEDGYFHIGFSGTFYSHINNPAPLFKAMAQLYQTAPEQASKVRFHHVGKSMISIEKLADQYGVRKNVVAWGYKSHRNCLEILAGMNALCFILDDRNKRSGYTIGGKVYEYLRLKKPIMALVPENGEAAQLIRETDSGVVVPGSDTVELVRILRQWIEKPEKFSYRGIAAFSRENLAAAFDTHLDQIIRHHGEEAGGSEKAF